MVVFWLFFILLFLAILVEKVINREKEIKNEKNKKKKVVTRMMESARISELKKREKKISDAVSAAVLDMDKDQEERFRAKLESYDLDDDEDEYGEKHELSVEESIAGAKEDMLNSNQWHFSYYHKTIFVGSVLSSNVIGLRIQETLGLFSYIGSDDNGYVISSIVGIVIFLSFWSFGYVMGERNTVQKKLKVKNDSSLRTWKWFILFYFSPLLIMLLVTSSLLIGIAGIDHLIISYL
jgi:Na+-transporting methylmalonyl-CoA/oxaloacetate decarboxylase gamma subunit